jgi:hypothetical protein
MNLHTSTRIPIDDEYALLIGKAVYAFAYYEWIIIWIIEQLEKGFVAKYSRGNSLTSGEVQKYFKRIVEKYKNDKSIKKEELANILRSFELLITKRNALIHAHPCTDYDGKQILNYQTSTRKDLPDMKWPKIELEKFIKIIDVAETEASIVLDKIR